MFIVWVSRFVINFYFSKSVWQRRVLKGGDWFLGALGCKYSAYIFGQRRLGEIYFKS